MRARPRERERKKNENTRASLRTVKNRRPLKYRPRVYLFFLHARQHFFGARNFCEGLERELAIFRNSPEKSRGIRTTGLRVSFSPPPFFFARVYIYAHASICQCVIFFVNYPVPSEKCNYYPRVSNCK